MTAYRRLSVTIPARGKATTKKEKKKKEVKKIQMERPILR
jgi:hypothetical protein